MTECSLRRAVSAWIVVPVLCLGVVPSEAWALSYDFGYIPLRHDRFYPHPDKDFLGEGYDWSGIAWTDGGYVLTMISPTYWVGAKHAQPPGTVTFYETNDFDGPNHTYSVASQRWYFGDDLVLGKLTTPLRPEDNISYYAVPKFASTSDYYAREAFYWGRGHKLGVTAVSSLSFTSSSRVYYSRSLTASSDRVYGTSGDSSHPSFLIGPDNRPAVLGTHYTQTSDNSVVRFIDDINAILAADGEQLTLMTDTTLPTPLPHPEPPTGHGLTFTWTGGGDGTRWSDPANWDQGAYTPGTGDTVLLTNASTVQDIPRLQIAHLDVTVSDGSGYALALEENLRVDDGDKARIPQFRLTDGTLHFDVNDRWFSWDSAGTGTHLGNLRLVIPDGMTVEMNDGALGEVGGTTCLKVASGGKITGTGGIYGTKGNPNWTGFNGFILEDGATIQIGEGELYFQDGASQAQLYGSIVGTGAQSRLELGAGGSWNLSTSATTTIRGLSELYITPGTVTFGRFEPGSVDFSGTTIIQNKPSTLKWEAQTTIDALDAFRIGALEMTGQFSGYSVIFQLVDSGTVDDDFAYIGQLGTLGTYQYVDLNGIALLTDMGESELAAMLGAGGFRNTGLGGSPLVKSVDLGGRTYWYVAPETVAIVPEPAAMGLLLVGMPLLLRRRRWRR